MDYTLCKGDNCPIKENCKRYTSIPDPVYQSYFVEPPFKDDKCDMLWNNSSDFIMNELIKITNER